jgi:DNA-binding GntR family transcriptional regulator
MSTVFSPPSRPRGAPLRRESLGWQTAREIREAILNGTYSLGQKLRESELTARFGASSSVIREALHVLQGEGLVVTKPYCGRAVFNLKRAEAEELVVMRASLESYAAYLAARKRTLAFVRSIVEVAARMSSAPPQNFEEWVSLELMFHRTVWEATGNEMLCRQLEQIVLPILAFTLVTASRIPNDVGRIWQTEIQDNNRHGHHMLAQTLVEGDPVRAHTEMLRHILSSDEDVQSEARRDLFQL